MSGKSVTKATPSVPAQLLREGDIIPAMSTEAFRPPPMLSPEDIESLRAGKTLTRTQAAGHPPPRASPSVMVKVVHYRKAGSNHIYTFEVV